MFNFFKKKVDYSSNLLEVFNIKSSSCNIVRFNNELESIVKQILNREKLLTVKDINANNLCSYKIIMWVVDENNFVIDDLDSLIKDIIRNSKIILNYYNKINRDKLSRGNSFNVLRLSPYIVEIKNFYKYIKHTI